MVAPELDMGPRRWHFRQSLRRSQSKYRVLYAATERFGCFVETLARYRIDPLLAAGMAEIAITEVTTHRIYSL